jgi:hypothetical protein
MKKLPNVITNLERSIALMEGIHAFDTGVPREHNPYIGRSDELMHIWWAGWDQAQGEANRK